MDDVFTDDILAQNAREFALRHRLQVVEQLGYGVHGIIFAVRGNSERGATAIKIHRNAEPYSREVAVYQRLKAASVQNILGFSVPRLLRHEDELRIIEMGVVTRPFVLDFAGAYLDFPPEFSDEVWEVWEAERIEQFGARWPKVREVLAALEELDIHLIDVSPSNIAFLEEGSHRAG